MVTDRPVSEEERLDTIWMAISHSGITTMFLLERIPVIIDSKYQIPAKTLISGLTLFVLKVTPFITRTDDSKKNISDLPLAMDTVEQLQSVQYKWKDRPRDTTSHYRFIAQDLEKVLPEIIPTAMKDTRAFDIYN